MNVLLAIIDLLLTVLRWIVLAQAILSILVSFNVINTHNDLIRSLYRGLMTVTEPLYRPIRRIMPDFGALDFSPFVVLLGIIILQNIILPAVGRVTESTFI